MAAMMLPSVTPMVVAYTGIGGERALTPVFVLGYLAVWTTYGLAAWMAAVALLILLEKALPGGERAARVTGFALIAAGTAALA